MELSYLLLMGSLSGLVSVLGATVIDSMLALVRNNSAAAPTLVTQLADALLHLLGGIGLGLLFWLSWGLAALVDVAWWVRGLSFAALCWSALTLPSVLSMVLTGGFAPEGKRSPEGIPRETGGFAPEGKRSPEGIPRETGSGRIKAAMAGSIAARWGATCVIAGLACAWSWERSV